MCDTLAARPLALLLFVLAGGATAAAPIEDLGWLSGCWQQTGAEQGSVEVWSEPAGGTMFGFNRSVRGGRTVAFEYLRIEAADDGSLRYVASPSGQSTTSFSLAASSDGVVEFVNLQHDFPQRIRYERTADDELLATISGDSGGKSRTIEFPMHRCPDTRD